MTAAPIAVTAGEPAGIGPDLCIALAALPGLPDFVVIGDAGLLRQRARTLGVSVTARSIGLSSVGKLSRDGELLVVDTPFPREVACGTPNADNSAVLLDGLRTAVDGCRDGTFSALVTAPLAKHVINDSGIPFTGHTEYLAALTGSDLPVMLLVAGSMRVALATTHLPLRDVAQRLSRERLSSVLSVLHAGLERMFGIASPKIIVCGLNPHAGENGLLGHEDAEIIAPVVAALSKKGMQLRGPVPADTAFLDAAGPRDAVLAMYHDQGLPVLKFAGFGQAVNVTLGLPIIRTSVDHGTAFDLAGTGKADAGSLVAAIRLAATLQCPR